MGEFQSAVPVWGENLSGKYNQFLGFHTEVETGKNGRITAAIAARSYYRLYINGEIKVCGPARAAKHYCRVDHYTFQISGKIHIAIEAAAYDKPEKYCNDCTLEPGMLAAEIMDEEGNMYCLEANTLPGMTPTSLIPQEAKVIGISYPRLCEKLIEVSLNKYR